jgi:hypothetical protein
MVCDVARLWRTQRILQRAETRLRTCRLRLRSSGYAHANWLRKPAWVHYQAFTTPIVSGEARKLSLHAQIRHGVPEIYDSTRRDRFDPYINGVLTMVKCAARDCFSVGNGNKPLSLQQHIYRPLWQNVGPLLGSTEARPYRIPA